jgi:hypothetical protein
MPDATLFNKDGDHRDIGKPCVDVRGFSPVGLVAAKSVLLFSGPGCDPESEDDVYILVFPTNGAVDLGAYGDYIQSAQVLG